MGSRRLAERTARVGTCLHGRCTSPTPTERAPRRATHDAGADVFGAGSNQPSGRRPGQQPRFTFLAVPGGGQSSRSSFTGTPHARVYIHAFMASCSRASLANSAAAPPAISAVDRHERLMDLVRRLAVAVLVTVAAILAQLFLPVFQRPLPGVTVIIDSQSVFIRAAEHSQPFKSRQTVPTDTLSYVGAVSAVGTVVLAAPGMRIATATTWLTAEALTDLLTTFGKCFCGYLRPNYYGGCGWNETLQVCDHEWPDGRHSFPSGHSSFSACSAAILSMAAMRAAERRRWAGGEGGVAAPALLHLLACASYAVAFFIALSRVYDNFHFPADVVAGSCLGYAVGAVAMQMLLPRPALGAVEDERSTVPLLAGGSETGPMIL